MYSAIFATLSEQEAAARARGGRGGADDAPAPGFGACGAACGDVLAFYAHWQGFSTAKDFAWADQYNPGSAPNRKARSAGALGRVLRAPSFEEGLITRCCKAAARDMQAGSRMRWGPLFYGWSDCALAC